MGPPAREVLATFKLSKVHTTNEKQAVKARIKHITAAGSFGLDQGFLS